MGKLNWERRNQIEKVIKRKPLFEEKKTRKKVKTNKKGSDGSPKDWVPMVSKFDSQCGQCKLSIKEGDHIKYFPELKRAVHVHCNEITNKDGVNILASAASQPPSKPSPIKKIERIDNAEKLASKHPPEGKSSKEFRLTIPKHEVIPIIDMLKEFEKLCDARGIKFSKYTPEQVFEVIKLYKNWKLNSEDPPF